MPLKTPVAIALPALLAATLFLPSAAANDLALADPLLAPEPFLVAIDLIDGAPVLSGSGAALCEVSLPDQTSEGIGLSVSCDPGDSDTVAATCHRVEVGVRTGSGGYGSASASCGSLNASCSASNGGACGAWDSGSSSGRRSCSFYLRSPASAYCAFS